MAASKTLQLKMSGNNVSIADEHGKVLLKDCYGAVQLSGGAQFSLQAMPTKLRQTKHRLVVTGGGDAALPQLSWQVTLLNKRTVSVTLQVTNTTSAPLAIERIDSLICDRGYVGIPFGELLARRTGWQSFSPASARVHADVIDPWLQPPVQAPMLLPSSAGQNYFPWMTVLQDAKTPPLLVGYGQANDYLGMIKLQASGQGHRMSASNYFEGIELTPGEAFSSEPLLIMGGDSEEVLLGEYAEFIQHRMQARTPKPPTGWCSWYYYFDSVTEKDILDNLAIIARKKLGLEYVQIDDGYQTYFGDWLSINDKFPHGMKYLADKIRGAGHKPGIWLAPFMADARSEVYQNHPEWFLRDDQGRPVNANRHGDPYWKAPNYGLDLTHPEAYAWLKDVLTTICHEWGYEYLKIDFLYAATLRAKRYDPQTTSVQAYRKGMALIREVAGDRFVVGCGAPLLCSVGYIDAMRINSDIASAVNASGDNQNGDLTKPRSRDSVASLWAHDWMNDRLWVNDPDCVRVRQHDIASAWYEIQSLASLAALEGGSMLDSDNLTTLEPEGYELLQRLLPSVPIKASTIGGTIGRPSKLKAVVTRGAASWHVLARYNWTTHLRVFRFYPKRWQLPTKRYHIVDLLTGAYLGAKLYETIGTIQPRGVQLLLVSPVTDRPQVVATNGHLLGPAGDLCGVVWKDKQLAIDIADRQNDDLIVTVYVPVYYRLQSVVGGEAVSHRRRVLAIRPDSRQCTLTFSLLKRKKI